MNKPQIEAMRKMKELIRFCKFGRRGSVLTANVSQLFDIMEVDLEMGKRWTPKQLEEFRVKVVYGLIILAKSLYRRHHGHIKLKVPLNWNPKTLKVSVEPTRTPSDSFEMEYIYNHNEDEEYLRKSAPPLILYKAIELLQILPERVLKICKDNKCNKDTFFLSTNSKREFCTDQCRIRYNVRKARDREKKKAEELKSLKGGVK